MAALRQPISLLATQVDVLPRVGIGIGIAGADDETELGCDVAQGYLLPRPLSPADAALLLRERFAAPLGVEGFREDAA